MPSLDNTVDRATAETYFDLKLESVVTDEGGNQTPTPSAISLVDCASSPLQSSRGEVIDSPNYWCLDKNVTQQDLSIYGKAFAANSTSIALRVTSCADTEDKTCTHTRFV